MLSSVAAAIASKPLLKAVMIMIIVLIDSLHHHTHGQLTVLTNSGNYKYTCIQSTVCTLRYEEPLARNAEEPTAKGASITRQRRRNGIA